MGVTLERVQNKFACIIGELCSEPDILSQFAIWVDLRIAEYKANGAIALDCSGSTPDPTWLKGLKQPTPVQPNASLQRGRDRLASRNAQHNWSSFQTTPVDHQTDPDLRSHQSGDNLSARVTEDLQRVVVKEELVNPADVYPVRLHSHNDTDLRHGNSWQRTTAEDFPKNVPNLNDLERTSAAISRKRQSSSIEEQYSLHGHSNIGTFSTSPVSKSRKLSSASENSLSTGQESNQSLLSVIGVADQMPDSTSTAVTVAEIPRGSNSGVTDHPTGPNHPGLLVGTDWMNYPGVQTGKRPVPDVEVIEVSDEVESSPEQKSRSRSLMHDTLEGKWQMDSRLVGQFCQSEQRVRWSTRMSLVKPNSTRKNTVCAVKTLSNFLASHNEFRKIEAIPPEDLDSYLVSFFSTIKRKNGTDYHPSSLISLRKFLDFHLKESGYPHAITTSTSFSKCQVAFRLKHIELQNALAMRKAEYSAYYGQESAPPSQSDPLDQTCQNNGQGTVQPEAPGVS